MAVKMEQIGKYLLKNSTQNSSQQSPSSRVEMAPIRMPSFNRQMTMTNNGNPLRQSRYSSLSSGQSTDSDQTVGLSEQFPLNFLEKAV